MITACNRISYEEACYLSRVLPIDILIRMAALRYWMLHDHDRADKILEKLGVTRLTAADAGRMTKKEFMSRIESEVWSVYYLKYAESRRRNSSRFFTTFADVKILDRLEPMSAQMIQLLSGKGNFESFLFQQRLLRSPVCRSCGLEEGTVEHHIERCEAQADLRLIVQDRIGTVSLAELNSSNLVHCLRELARLVPFYSANRN